MGLLKDIKFGDCFAYEIKNDPELNGRYFIMCSRNVRNEEKIDLMQSFFLLKITKDNILPKTEKEINELENVLVSALDKNIWYSGMTKEEVLEKNGIAINPDENGFLYMYTFYTRLTRKKYLKDFIYLGNYNIDYPENEYVLPKGGQTSLISMDRFEELATYKYKGNNWKKFGRWHLSEEQKQKNAELWASVKKGFDEIMSQDS